MAVSRRRKAKQDDFITAQDLFGGKESMWPQTREELIERNRPSRGDGYQVLAMAVCGTPPEGDEPYGVTDEWIWSVEEITPTMPGCDSPYRRIVVSQIVNPKPGCWLAAWKGREGASNVPLSCPPELFKLVLLSQLAPVEHASWRAEVEANPDRPAPSMLDMGEIESNEGGLS